MSLSLINTATRVGRKSRLPKLLDRRVCVALQSAPWGDSANTLRALNTLAGSAHLPVTHLPVKFRSADGDTFACTAGLARAKLTGLRVPPLPSVIVPFAVGTTR